MQPSKTRLPSPQLRSCDSEPIHIPGLVQPHGLLLLFNSASERLAHWAGDPDLLGGEPIVGKRADELLGAPLQELIGSRLLIAGQEAIHAGSIKPRGKGPLAVLVGRTGPFLSVELEPSGPFTTTAAALEQVRNVSDRIGSMPSLADAYDAAARQVRATTGYDRVMIYRFLEDGSGSVVAEARAHDVTSFMNHRFPASDIPVQARELYRRNLIRVIPDVGYTPAPLRPEGGGVIDMSHCVLRSISPVHVQYLKNMDVGASMSVSLLVEGRLWGLIACHHRSARHVSPEARLLCRHVGTTLSAFILSFGYAEEARRSAASSTVLEETLKSLRSASDPERMLRSSAEQLARLVDCGSFALLAQGEMVAGVGRLPDASWLRELAPLVEAKLEGSRCLATESVAETFSGAFASAQASGMLAIRINASSPLLALWLRAEQIEEVSWAGDPRSKDEPTANGAPNARRAADNDMAHGKELTGGPLKTLTPRLSFATWRETVRGRSRPWTWQDINSVELFQNRAEFTMQRHRLTQLNEELGQANATLSELATTDPLTGLPNRRLFDERLTAAWQRALRDHSSVAVVAIDVDNFKIYNDRLGHPAGDECLKKIAAAIGKAHRRVDVAARIGGEEFALLLSGAGSRGAAVLAERSRLAVEKLGLDHPQNPGGVVTISLGVAAGSPAQWSGPEQLIAAADQALYEAKNSGRNKICTATAPA